MLIGELTNCTVFFIIQDSPLNATKIVNKTVIFTTSPINIINLHTYLCFRYLRIYMLNDGPSGGPKHVALLTDAIKSSNVRI